MGSSRTMFEFFAIVVLSVMLVESALGINCYQCVSTDNAYPFQCNEFLPDDNDLQKSPCDAVHNAKFCIKRVGRFKALGLNCYECTSADEWKCMDSELVADALKPRSCDYIFEAQYCVKTIGRYGGGLGTERFCSSLDMGNYCQYVKNPGDSLEYRTCVYTCNSDGCNPASTTKPNLTKTIIPAFLALLLALRR